jgi:hypothetical protein
MVYFQTKNANLGKFWGSSDWKMLIYFKATWHIIWTFGIFYDGLVHFVLIWYIYSGFGMYVSRKIWQPWSIQTEEQKTLDEMKQKMNEKSGKHFLMDSLLLIRFAGRCEALLLFFFIYIFVADAFISPFSTHKQCILSHFMHNSTAMFP